MVGFSRKSASCAGSNKIHKLMPYTQPRHTQNTHTIHTLCVPENGCLTAMIYAYFQSFFCCFDVLMTDSVCEW